MNICFFHALNFESLVFILLFVIHRKGGTLLIWYNGHFHAYCHQLCIVYCNTMSGLREVTTSFFSASREATVLLCRYVTRKKQKNVAMLVVTVLDMLWSPQFLCLFLVVHLISCDENGTVQFFVIRRFKGVGTMGGKKCTEQDCRCISLRVCLVGLSWAVVLKA